MVADLAAYTELPREVVERELRTRSGASFRAEWHATPPHLRQRPLVLPELEDATCSRTPCTSPTPSFVDRYVLPHVPAGGRVLDFGAGTGQRWRCCSPPRACDVWVSELNALQRDFIRFRVARNGLGERVDGGRPVGGAAAGRLRRRRGRGRARAPARLPLASSRDELLPALAADGVLVENSPFVVNTREPHAPRGLRVRAVHGREPGSRWWRTAATAPGSGAATDDQRGVPAPSPGAAGALLDAELQHQGAHLLLLAPGRRGARLRGRDGARGGAWRRARHRVAPPGRRGGDHARHGPGARRRRRRLGHRHPARGRARSTSRSAARCWSISRSRTPSGRCTSWRGSRGSAPWCRCPTRRRGPARAIRSTSPAGTSTRHAPACRCRAVRWSGTSWRAAFGSATGSFSASSRRGGRWAAARSSSAACRSRAARGGRSPGSQHFWEVGAEDTPLERLLGAAEAAGFAVERTYRVPENPWHRFLVLRLRQEASS